MMPPICSFCHARFDPFKSKGELLHFKISDEDKASNQRMRDSHRLGHAKGAHWFCEAHVDAARELKDLEIKDALAQMRERKFGWRWLRALIGRR
jgi:hypothetical protein